LFPKKAPTKESQARGEVGSYKAGFGIRCVKMALLSGNIFLSPPLLNFINHVSSVVFNLHHKGNPLS
jgi:hypothetical protein